MPMFWWISVCELCFIIMVMCMLFYNKMMEFMFLKNYMNNVCFSFSFKYFVW